MEALTPEAWITLGVLAAVLAILIANVVSADVVMVVALAILLFSGVLTVPQALEIIREW